MQNGVKLVLPTVMKMWRDRNSKCVLSSLLFELFLILSRYLSILYNQEAIASESAQDYGCNGLYLFPVSFDEEACLIYVFMGLFLTRLYRPSTRLPRPLDLWNNSVPMVPLALIVLGTRQPIKVCFFFVVRCMFLIDKIEDTVDENNTYPPPHDAPRTPEMDQRCWEIKWSHRDDAVSALNVGNTLPTLSLAVLTSACISDPFPCTPSHSNLGASNWSRHFGGEHLFKVFSVAYQRSGFKWVTSCFPIISKADAWPYWFRALS